MRSRKEWSEYPEGTKAYAPNGGYWVKNSRGFWVWCTAGGIFPTPGGDWVRIEEPGLPTHQHCQEVG